MPYNLRDESKLVLPKTTSSLLVLIHYNLEGVFLWDNLPVSLRNCLNEFKIELKNLGNIYCTCLVCR